jgi:hypothetical protein
MIDRLDFTWRLVWFARRGMRLAALREAWSLWWGVK